MSRRNLWAWLVAALWLYPGNLPALDPNCSIFQFGCQSWGREKGLPAANINGIAQTHDGYLWLATQRGLVRFDGLEFKPQNPLGLPASRAAEVRALTASTDGTRLWLALDGGSVGQFDNREFTPIPDSRFSFPNLKPFGMVADRSGAVWLADYSVGLGMWSPGDAQKAILTNASPGCTSVFVDPSGRIWLGTVEHGLYFWQGGTLHPFPDESIAKHIVFSFAVDSQGLIWVGLENELRCYGPDFTRRDIAPVYNDIRALLADRHGRLWIGTADNGLARYEPGEVRYLGKAQGLAGDFVNCLYEDREGSLWVGTHEGLSQLTDVKIPICSPNPGPEGTPVMDVCTAEAGGVWGSMRHGFARLMPDGIWLTNTPPDCPDPYFKRIFEAKDQTLYAVDGRKDILVISGNQLKCVITNRVWPTCFAEWQNKIIVGYGGSLQVLEENRLRPFPYQKSTPSFYWVNNLWSTRDGHLWVASNNGLARVAPDGSVQQWDDSKGLRQTIGYSVSECADGSIVAGLSIGLAFVRNEHLTLLGTEQGLYDSRIFAIVQDDRGDLWMTSSRGIFRLSFQNLQEVVDGKAPRLLCQPFDSADAIKFAEFGDQEQEFSGCKTRDGCVWFPNSKGIVKINPASLRTNCVPPSVHIESATLNRARLLQGDKVLASGNGLAEFRFTATSFIAPQKIRLRYRLEGWDKDWTLLTNQRSASYPDLKPGRYTFRVQAANADGIWNETGDSLTFTLPVPFYDEFWFRALIGLVILGVLASLHRGRIRIVERRERRLREDKELLEAKVVERTRELAVINAELQTEIKNHELSEARLQEEIAERKRWETRQQELHQELVVASRMAGMAEVATSVLHNVGNVLNSVNVSASVVMELVKNSKSVSVARVAKLLRENEHDLAKFLVQDEKGRRLPSYLDELAERLGSERESLLNELRGLTLNIEHIKQIVAMQQANARLSGVTETLAASSLVEDAIRLQTATFQRHDIRLVRRFSEVPPLLVDRHKVAQILVNLLQNAKHACDDSGRRDKEVVVSIEPRSGDTIAITVQDNGVGIPAENLTRIFSHGFTTRKNGHGFGLHSGALAAKEMGGHLYATSDGPGQGATFVLELPVGKPQLHADSVPA